MIFMATTNCFHKLLLNSLILPAFGVLFVVLRMNLINQTTNLVLMELFEKLSKAFS